MPLASKEIRPLAVALLSLAIPPGVGPVAARRKNWTYAAYELAELRNALARVGRTIPLYRSVDTPVIIEATSVPLAALEQATRARDARAFAAAYADLTAACNACHQSQEHAMVVIRVPRGDAYPDQSFEPAP